MRLGYETHLFPFYHGYHWLETVKDCKDVPLLVRVPHHDLTNNIYTDTDYISEFLSSRLFGKHIMLLATAFDVSEFSEIKLCETILLP